MEWRRQHPRLTLGGLVVLTGLLAWAGYQGGRYFWGRSHFQAAQQAAKQHAWDEAHAHLQACLRSSPDDPAVLFLAARAARHLDYLDEAARHLDACERLQGGETQATKVERALLRVYQGDLAGTETFLRTCIAQNDPDTVEILDILSAALIVKYRVAEAQQCLDDLLQRQPDHFPALVRRAWTARSAGTDTFAQAVEYFEKALALRPDADTVRLALAEMQVATGRFADAEQHFQQLLPRDPENPSVIFGLARCLAGKGQAEQALAVFDRLIADYPNDWKALGERGRLTLQFDRPGEAEGYLRRAVALAPFDLPILTRYVECLRLLGKDDEASKYQAQADQLQADFRRAEQLGTLIREQKPHDPALRHELASLLLRLGKPEDALHWFQTALAKDPQHQPTHQALLEFYEKAGDRKQAAHHRQVLRQIESKR
jgi:predicted Zn-dependent protease